MKNAAVPIPVQVRSILKRPGWTQPKLAKVVGVRQNTISRLANDVRHDSPYLIGKRIEAVYASPRMRPPVL